jgi:hypothetical protein
MLPLGVDAGYQIGDGFMPCLGDILQAIPELIFYTDTAPATSNFKPTSVDAGLA